MKRCIYCHLEIINGVDSSQCCPNGHFAHSECLKKWLLHSSDCPLCSIPYSGRVILQTDISISNLLKKSDLQWIKCPDCERKIAKKEFFTHSCKIKPYEPRIQRPKSPMNLRRVIMGELRHLFSRRTQSEQIAAQIPEEENKEERSRLSDEDIIILDLESEEGIKLMKQYAEEIGEIATQKGKETNKFVMWLKGEDVETLNARLLCEREESVKNYRESFLKENYREKPLKEIRKRRSKDSLDKILKKLLRAIPEIKSVAIVSDEGLPIASALSQSSDEKRIAAMTAALLSLSEKAIIEMRKGDFDQLYIKGGEGFLLVMRVGPKAVLMVSTTKEVRLGLILLNLRRFSEKIARSGQYDDDGDRFPYPYIFKPPEPPDDLALAPRVQLRASPKKKVPEEKIHCQFCGMKLTKEEQLTHSCKKKPINK